MPILAGQMGRATPKLSPAQRFLIYELKKAGKSGAKVQQLCAEGHGEHPPFSVSPSRANEIGREVADERGELYDSELVKRPPHEVTRKLSRRLIHIADRESERLDRAQRTGRLNLAQLGQLAKALGNLHDLLERTRPHELGDGDGDSPSKPEDGSAKKDDSPPASAWVASAVQEDDEPPEPPAGGGGETSRPASVGDVALGPQGGSLSRHDRTPTVPAAQP